MKHVRASFRIAGFSLVEAAVVLGVAGVILGGVWAVIGKNKEVVAIQDAAGQLSVFNKNIRGYYQSLDSCVRAANGTDLTAALVGIVDPPVVPREMLTGGNIVTPWNTNVNVFSIGSSTDCSTVGSYRYEVIYRNLPTSTCINFAVKIGAPGEVSRGLVDMKVGAAGGAAGSGNTVVGMPPNPGVLAGANWCGVGAAADLHLIYRLRLEE